MSAEDRIQIIKEQNKARARKYYEANKAVIAERRKEARQACHEALGKAPVVEAKPEPVKAPRLRVKRPVVAKEEAVEVEVKAPRFRVKRPKTVEQAQKEAEVKAKQITYEQAVEIIATTDSILSDQSRTLYRNHLKTVKEILNCNDLVSCFQDAPENIKKLDNAKQKRDQTKGYSINSKKSYVQMILKLSDVLGIPLTAETKQQYVDAFDVLKLDSKKQTSERQEEGKKEEQLTYETYLPKVSEKYGQDSKENLIASLYSIHGFRDNLQLRIVKVPQDVKDNQLILPVKQGEPYKILLTKYKTNNKYGAKTITLPDSISKMVRVYLNKNKRKINDYLFGSEKLSGFISKFNKQMGLPITINTYREMHVSPVIDGMDSKERVDLARKMGHSVATSANYKQKKK
jgi:hypothetical protein